jgi:hypothetical protein
MWRLLLVICFSFLGACSVPSQTAIGEYQYGKKINYLDRETKKLPYFSIRFLKERHEQSPMFRPGFTFYDFEITNGTETKTVSWSSGTGDIGPTFFDFNGHPYVLELKASKAFNGFMNDGEMLVWKRGDYDKL